MYVLWMIKKIDGSIHRFVLNLFDNENLALAQCQSLNESEIKCNIFYQVTFCSGEALDNAISKTLMNYCSKVALCLDLADKNFLRGKLNKSNYMYNRASFFSSQAAKYLDCYE